MSSPALILLNTYGIGKEFEPPGNQGRLQRRNENEPSPIAESEITRAAKRVRRLWKPSASERVAYSYRDDRLRGLLVSSGRPIYFFGERRVLSGGPAAI